MSVDRGSGAFSSGGPGHGIPATPAWERIGRLAIGLHLLVQGVPTFVIEAWRLARGDFPSPGGIVGIVVFGGYAVLAGLRALKGRFVLAGILYALGVVSLGLTVWRPSFLPGVGTESWTWSAAANAAQTLLALGWILGRWFVRQDGNQLVMRVLTVAQAAAFVAILPSIGVGLGRGVALIAEGKPPSHGVVLEGQAIPRLEFTSLEGRTEKVEDRDAIYVLNFWATWCGPCRQELPELLAASRGWDAERVRLIAVNTEGLPADQLKSFLRENDLEGLPVFSDSTNASAPLGTEVIPVTLLIKERRVLHRIQGYSKAAIPDLDRRVRELLAAPAGVKSAGS